MSTFAVAVEMSKRFHTINNKRWLAQDCRMTRVWLFSVQDSYLVVVLPPPHYQPYRFEVWHQRAAQIYIPAMLEILLLDSSRQFSVSAAAACVYLLLKVYPDWAAQGSFLLITFRKLWKKNWAAEILRNFTRKIFASYLNPHLTT